MSLQTKKLRVGVIGLGVGQKHIAGYQSHPACEVVKLCDFDESVISNLRKNNQAYELTCEAQDILDDPDIDIVSIASWDNYHYEQVIRGLKNDKHLFIEKPLCMREEEAQHIVELWKEKPHLKISSNLILRRSERFLDLKKMIEHGELGEISYIKGSYNYGRLSKITEGWRGKIDYYSPIFGGGIHVVDLMLWMTKQRIVEVASYGNHIQSKHSNYRFEDMVATILKFENGAVATLATNLGCVFPHFHQFEVYGTKATFINEYNRALLYTHRDENKFREINTAYPGVHKGDFIYNFVEAVLNNREPEISMKEIFDTMAVCLTIEKSIKEGPVKVRYFL